jgi:hypothetical protein
MITRRSPGVINTLPSSRPERRRWSEGMRCEHQNPGPGQLPDRGERTRFARQGFRRWPCNGWTGPTHPASHSAAELSTVDVQSVIDFFG